MCIRDREKAMKLKKRVKGAMTYPAAVLFISLGVVALLLIKVIPVFQKMFEGMGGQLPGPTAMLIAASEFAQSYFFVIIIIPVVTYIAFNRFYKTEKGRLLLDSLVLKAPVFGPLLKKVAVAKFSRTLSTMMLSLIHI